MAILAMVAASTATASAAPSATLLVTGLASGSGSTVGPDGALYVTEGVGGRVLRVDPATGEVTTFASGLPEWIVGLGGAMDVAFTDGTAYVLVTVVGSDVGGTDVVGIYRIDGPSEFTVIADIGAFAVAHPPTTDFFIPTGLQYAMQPYRGGFLVTDGHHNRVYRVTLDGQVTEMVTFGNIVPTGLETRGNTIYMAEAGPNPHEPQTGRIVSFGTKDPSPVVVASGGRLLVDVEFGGRSLYGLSQGVFPLGAGDGSPALPNTGSLLLANEEGGFSVVVSGLNQPTSLEFIGTTAFVVSLGGQVWRIDNARGPHASD